MSPRPRRLIVLCGVVPVLFAAMLLLYRPRMMTTLEYVVHDVLVRAAGTRPHSGAVAIIDVDERSLREVGQWPWRRDVIGELIAGLRDFGAAVVAIDIVFAEPDRHEGNGRPPDAALADALLGGRVVLGYGMTFDRAALPADRCGHPLGLALVSRGDERERPFFRATGAVCNLETLTRAAAASGFLNAAPDADGRLRRVPLLVERDGRIYPSLALAAVNAVAGARDMTLQVANVNASMLSLDRRQVPLDGKSNLLLRYRGPKGTFPYFSAVDVLRRRLPAATFDGVIVFVGTTALGTREVVTTPLDTMFTGVEVQATVADNLLQQDFFHRPEHTVQLEMGALLALGVLVALLAGRFGMLWAGAAAAALLAGVWSGAVWLLSTHGTLLSPLFPSIGLGGALALMTVAGFAAERRRADQAGAENVTSRRLMIESLLSLTEIRDAETGRHSRRIQDLTRVLATELARRPGFRDYLTPERVELLSTLGPLHDIGKVGIADDLLHKPGALSETEMAEMRRHPEYGRDVILKAQREARVVDDEALTTAKDITYTHHERWDGRGYPQGLRETAIPVAGRVIAIVDAYDALRSRRPYSEPVTHDQAVAALVGRRGTHFDPAVVDAFVAVAEQFRRIAEAGAS